MYFPRKGVINLPLPQIHDFLQRVYRKEIELLARPGQSEVMDEEVVLNDQVYDLLILSHVV